MLLDLILFKCIFKPQEDCQWGLKSSRYLGFVLAFWLYTHPLNSKCLFSSLFSPAQQPFFKIQPVQCQLRKWSKNHLKVAVGAMSWHTEPCRAVPVLYRHTAHHLARLTCTSRKAPWVLNFILGYLDFLMNVVGKREVANTFHATQGQ